jgi:anti-sigma factor RsiW
MNCREFVGFLMDYPDGALPGSQRDVFDQHMVDCPSCETYLDTYRERIRLGKVCRDSEGPVPDDVPEALVKAILAARAKR